GCRFLDLALGAGGFNPVNTDDRLLASPGQAFSSVAVSQHFAGQRADVGALANLLPAIARPRRGRSERPHRGILAKSPVGKARGRSAGACPDAVETGRKTAGGGCPDVPPDCASHARI